jgi:uncharacterized membrane protein YedE/YeeE
MIYPPMPEPHPSMFDSEEKYLAAKSEWIKHKKQRDSIINGQMAFAIVMAGFMAISGVSLFLVLIFMEFGWRGVFMEIAIAGLFWAAQSRIRMFLERM